MIAKWNHHDRGKNALKPATGHKICGWKLAGQFADQKQNMLDQNLWLSINLYQSIQVCAVQRVNHLTRKRITSRRRGDWGPCSTQTEGSRSESRLEDEVATGCLLLLRRGQTCRWILEVPRVSSFQLKDMSMEKNIKHPNLGMGQNLLWH